jgi:AhpD family alkylhydroperoxidase
MVKSIVNPAIKYGLQTTPPNAAAGLTAAVYAQINHDMMNVPPPFTIHSPSPALLAGLWSIFRETLVAGRVDRGLKEGIATAISEINRCTWCVDSHAIALYATGNGDSLRWLQQHRNAQPNGLQSPLTHQLMTWALATRTPSATVLSQPPFEQRDAAEIIGTALTFHYLNRIVNALLVESPFTQQGWQKTLLQRGVGLIFRQRTSLTTLSGTTAAFLPEADLPPDFAWAAGTPAIAAAFARFAKVVDDGGRRALPDAVRRVVGGYVSQWQGDDPGLSRRWVDEALRPLEPAHQPAARLALLGAIAPHQIDASIVNAYRGEGMTDTAVVEALAWAGFAAAQRISTWLIPAHWAR